jgi:redox-sensing transcriptional repressor
MGRLPIYYRYLEELQRMGVDRISSDKLAERIGITSSQLRQDLSAFGQFGHHGLGYHVGPLLERVSDLLGLNQPHRLVLVGAGNLGRAVASYEGFTRRGFLIKRIFDADPQLAGTYIAGAPVAPVTELGAYLAAEPTDVGVIATPATAAQEIADTLVAGGVRAIWNFAPVRLAVPDHVLVEHTHISDSLLLLSLRLHMQD